jgi:hypothetical protein
VLGEVKKHNFFKAKKKKDQVKGSELIFLLNFFSLENQMSLQK